MAGDLLGEETTGGATVTSFTASASAGATATVTTGSPVTRLPVLLDQSIRSFGCPVFRLPTTG